MIRSGIRLFSDTRNHAGKSSTHATAYRVCGVGELTASTIAGVVLSAGGVVSSVELSFLSLAKSSTEPTTDACARE